ncbi:MAG: hypothetical protein JWM28_1089 [Chitinophagaceae bacterium]|nr:hypothetical protein [Chitinophagaceae bacterium]
MNKIIVCLVSLLVFRVMANEKLYAQPVTKRPPILILDKPGGFGAYTAELLKTEGFNEYDILNIDKEAVSLTTLKSYDLLILPHLSISDSQTRDIVQYVEAGGNLVSFLPSSVLLKLLKAGSIAGILPGGYIQIDTGNAIGKGLLPVPLKFHGDAILVNNAAAKVIARFYPASLPAMISHRFGKGQVICFLYDLPKNILLTRQGNPDWAGREMDGIFGIRAMDLFTNNWVDSAMNCLNHADEQLRLLTHGIEFLSQDKKPLPRFWYFPDTLTCLATLTNDGEDNVQEDFIPQFQDVGAKGAKMSLYSLRTDKMSKSFADSLIREGHEVAGHPDATLHADKPTWAIMTKAIQDKFTELKAYQGVTNITTNVNHWFVWCGTDSAGYPDFTAEAKIETNEGIKLDMNYAHYDNNSSQPHFLGASGKSQGNFEGSGLPIRFADTKGNIVDIFQHFNNVYDQQYMEHKDSVGFFECFKGLVDRSMDNEVYSYISIKAHNNEYFFSKTPLMQMLDYANQQKVPVWAAADLYQFLKVKDEAYFSDFNFKKGTLTFTIHSALSNSNALSFLVPFEFNRKSVSVINGNKRSYPVVKKKIKGLDYAWVTIQPGKQYAFRVDYK